MVKNAALPRALAPLAPGGRERRRAAVDRKAAPQVLQTSPFSGASAFALPSTGVDTTHRHVCCDRICREQAASLKQACEWADSSKLAVALHAASAAGVVRSEVIRGESCLNASLELRCDHSEATMQCSARALGAAQGAGRALALTWFGGCCHVYAETRRVPTTSIASLPL